MTKTTKKITKKTKKQKINAEDLFWFISDISRLIGARVSSTSKEAIYFSDEEHKDFLGIHLNGGDNILAGDVLCERCTLITEALLRNHKIPFEWGYFN